VVRAIVVEEQGHDDDHAEDHAEDDTYHQPATTEGPAQGRFGLFHLCSIIEGVKKPLEPLIPLDDLKDVVRGLIAVPKARIVKPGVNRAKRKGTRKPRKR